MQNEKCIDFERDARKVGFRKVRQEGSHVTFERVQSFTVPMTKTEISGPMAKRFRKEFNF